MDCAFSSALAKKSFPTSRHKGFPLFSFGSFIVFNFVYAGKYEWTFFLFIS